jgi:predicted GH43/DUF377 family glycosyl hydrolase
MPRCHKGYIRGSYYDEEAGVTRYYMENYVSRVRVLESSDGLSFRPRDDVVLGGSEDDDFRYGIEDIRIIGFADGEYILIGCGKKVPPFKGPGGDRIAIYTTRDFISIAYRGIVEPFDSRNAVIFPEYIGGKLYMIFRFHSNIHMDIVKYGLEQLCNPKEYNQEWVEIYRNRDRNTLLEAGRYTHEFEKIGAGPPPIKTKEGWLLIYHSVGSIGSRIAKMYGLDGPVKRGYSISAALLDLNDPREVLYRSRYPIYLHHMPWEHEGDEVYPIDIPHVVFPTGAFTLGQKLLVYAGAGDKYVILLSTGLEPLIDYLIKYGEPISS